jgi:hypothetical protein
MYAYMDKCINNFKKWGLGARGPIGANQTELQW